MVLEEAFIQKCREAFNTFDADGSGSIDSQEMRLLLEAIGENPTEEELFRFMADVDRGGNGEIEFSEFLRAFEKQRSGYVDPEEEAEILYAFVALGGNRDGTGYMNSAEFERVVRKVYGLAVKTDRLIEQLDVNKNGRLNYTDFKALFF